MADDWVIDSSSVKAGPAAASVVGTCASRQAVIPGYTSTSEFFTRAADHYLENLDAESLTHQIDSALEHIDALDDGSADAVAAGHRMLDAVGDDW